MCFKICIINPSLYTLFPNDLVSQFNHSFANTLTSITPSAFHCPTQEKPKPHEPGKQPSPPAYTSQGNAGIVLGIRAPQIQSGPQHTPE